MERKNHVTSVINHSVEQMQCVHKSKSIPLPKKKMLKIKISEMCGNSANLVVGNIFWPKVRRRIAAPAA